MQKQGTEGNNRAPAERRFGRSNSQHKCRRSHCQCCKNVDLAGTVVVHTGHACMSPLWASWSFKAKRRSLFLAPERPPSASCPATPRQVSKLLRSRSFPFALSDSSSVTVGIHRGGSETSPAIERQNRHKLARLVPLDQPVGGNLVFLGRRVRGQARGGAVFCDRRQQYSAGKSVFRSNITKSVLVTSGAIPRRTFKTTSHFKDA